MQEYFFFKKYLFSLVNCILSRFFIFIFILWNWIKGLNLNNFEFCRIQLKESKIRRLKWISLKLRRCILHFSISFNYVPFHQKNEKKKTKKRLSISLNENLLFIFYFPIKQIHTYKNTSSFSTFNSQIYKLEISNNHLQSLSNLYPLRSSICTYIFG